MRRYWLALAFASVPTVSFAAALPTTFCGLVTLLVNMLNAFTAFLVLASLAAYLYGITMNMASVGESNKTKLKNILTWGIIGLFVMVSIWGILHLLQSSLFPVDTASGRSC